MSRRHRTDSLRQRNLALPIMLAGALLIAAAAFVFARQGGGGAGDGGTPQIALDPAQIEYGYVKFGETRSFKIAVTNNGDGPLRFKSKPYIEVLEGC